MIHFGGRNYSPGAENMVVDITPPPCLWIPQGDAHTGSQVVIDFYNNTDPGAGALFDGQHAFQEAKQLVTQNPDAPRDVVRAAGQPERHPGPDTGVPERAAVSSWDVPGAPLPRHRGAAADAGPARPGQDERSPRQAR